MPAARNLPSMSLDLTDLSATELAASIARRDVSAIEATTAYLDRIGERNPLLNAIVHLDAEGALRSARRLDQRRSLVGPLHGVPMTLKESHRVAGLPMDVGDPDAPSAPATVDGEVAARLRAAGAVLLGTTNVARDLGDLQTDNPVHGRTNNPWDVSRTPGGSSGGAAAALADRMTALEVGSDIAGSVRVPAAFTGVFGLMPTPGTVPVRGHLTQPGQHPRGGGINVLANIGPLARTIPDLRLLLSALTGVPWPSAPIRRASIGLIPELPGLRVQASIRDAVLAAGAVAERLGARVSLAGAPGPRDQEHRAFVDRYDAARRYGRRWPNRRPATARAKALAEAAWSELLGRHQAILMPAAMTTAFAHRPTGTPIEIDGVAVPYWGLTRYAEPTSLAGLPSLVLPVGLDADGMPIGLQLVVAQGRDAWLMGLGEWLHGAVSKVQPANRDADYVV